MDIKKKKKIIKIFLFALLIISILSPCSHVYAEINSKYGTQPTTGTYASATDSAEPGTILGILCVALVSVGKLVEGLVAWLIQLLSQSSTAYFPWADRIIFNTIPILDVNFINPASGSLFDIGGGQIGTVVRNIYFTGLSIAVGFLSIIVAIMAVRMAISTIASEKARYKESIVTLLTTLVLLFGVHFLLSLVFYVNEKLVEVASDIVKDSVAANNVQIGSSTSSDSSQVISNLGDYFYEKALEQGGTTDLFSIQKAAPIPTVLYLVFIIQSLMFLFAYFKRFFYVVILAVLAPFVVIYDFLGKSLS